MAKTIGNDVETFRRAVAWHALDLGAPRLEITAEQARRLAEGDEATREEIRTLLIRRDLWEQNVNPEYLAARSFGFQVQHKGRDRLARLCGLEKINVHVEGELRALPDTELLALVGTLGLLADPDTTGTVPRNSASPLMLSDAIGSVSQPEDEHR